MKMVSPVHHAEMHPATRYSQCLCTSCLRLFRGFVVSIRLLALSLFVVSVLSGYMRFGRDPAGFAEALTIIFLISTTAFVVIMLRLFAHQVDLLGEAVAGDREKSGSD